MIYPINSINFKAKININRAEISQKLSADKKLDGNCLAEIGRILDKVDTFSKMPESSIVTIEPIKYTNSNVFKLLCRVTDKDNIARRTIMERSARKLATDTDFANRYVTNIQKAIKDIELEGQSLKQIRETIETSKTIKGISNFDESYLRALSKEETAEYFINKTKLDIDEKFKEGINPTERIISVLTKIDEGNPESSKYISIGRNNKGPMRFKVIYQNPDGTTQSASIPLSTLMHDSIDGLYKI